MKLSSIFKAGLAGLLFSATAAQAASVSSQLFPGLIQLSDNSAEYLINADGSFSDTDSTVDVGDRLVGIFTIETVEQLSTGDQNLLGANGNNELAGVFDLTIAAKIATPTGYNFAFAPTTSTPTGGLLSAYGAGTAVAMFEDAALEYSRLNDTIANLTTNITNGSLLMTFGFGANSFWNANASTDDISVVGMIPAPGNGGLFNLGLDVYVNNTGNEFDTVSCFNAATTTVETVDACGSGSLLGTGGANTPFDSFNNVDFVMNRIPAPSTLLLLGLGLLGLARFKKQS